MNASKPTTEMDIERTASPEPLVRTASSDSSILLRHPTPDLQASQGAYVGNVERLERSAERLSLGSDIAEEIRKLQVEQKQSDSRRSSLRSAALGEPKPLPKNRSRTTSNSSYANSILDVNNTARWGGYSPAGYVPSSAGSVRSGSWSQPSQVSAARKLQPKSSRVSQVVNIEPKPEKQAPHSPTSPTSLIDSPSVTSPTSEPTEDETASQPLAASSFAAAYDEIAEEVGKEHKLQVEQQPDEAGLDVEQTHQDLEVPEQEGDEAERPPTADSSDTYQQVRRLFNDFDGVHYQPSLDFRRPNGPYEHDPYYGGTFPSRHTYVQPPPGENMVYYPAPVPKLLNLPKRLSQMPPASVQAKRQTQLLESMPSEARKSAVWLSEPTADAVGPGSASGHADTRRRKMESRLSTARLSGLPPQLRASAFFDHQAVPQNIEVKGESAVATLNSILQASAHAPVGAFTDHPFAGRVGDEVYGKEHSRETARRTVSGPSTERPDPRKSRSSLNLLFRRKSSIGQLREQSEDVNISRMSVANPAIEGPHIAEGPNHGTEEEEADHDADESAPLRQSPPEAVDDLGDENAEGAWDHDNQQQLESVQGYGPPTTLLAELQLRKQQQRQRNRTAATAFPNGMHSTLLELDAVAQIEKKRRMGHRVALAWEDPDAVAAEEADQDDEDIPLGVLFPSSQGILGKNSGQGQSDWDRPLGLMARRELEDNEPLSSRRNRLLGIDPVRREHSPGKQETSSLPLIHTPNDPHADKSGDDDDGEEETLAQRLRRLKNRETLNAAISEVSARPVSGDFASEMFSHFGVTDRDKASPKLDPSTANPAGNDPNGLSEGEEETLGQRRKRLQAEAAARSRNTSGGTQAQPDVGRPPLKARHSMADILTAHPAGGTRKVSNEMLAASLTPGSLLQQNEQQQFMRRTQLYEQNRHSSYGLERPLVDLPNSYAGPMQGPRASGVYGNGFLNNSHTMFPPGPTMGPNVGPGVGLGLGAPMGGGYYGNGMGMAANPYGYGNPAFAQHMAMNNGVGGYGAFAYQQQNNMPMMQGMGGMNGMNGMNGMGGMGPAGGGMGMNPANQAPPMDPRQRDMIDRWRQSIM